MSQKSTPTASYMKYSGLAFQMFFLLLAGWFMGSWIDDYFGFEKPYIGALLAFLFLIGFFYKIYREVVSGKL